MKSSDSVPAAWTGRPVLRFWHWCVAFATQALSMALQSAGVYDLNAPPIAGAVRSATPLYVYYAGFGLQIIGIFFLITTLLRVSRITLNADSLQIGRMNFPLAAATLRVGTYTKLGRAYRLLQVSTSPKQVLSIRTPGLAPVSRPDLAPLLAPARTDVVLGPLDFDELVAALRPTPAQAVHAARRIEVVPYRGTGRSVFEFSRPFYLAILVCAVVGVGSSFVIATSRVVQAIATPVCLLAVSFGIVGTFVRFHRPSRLLRLLLADGELSVWDARLGVLVARAPLSDVRVERFHYALFGKSDSLTNPGLRLTLPGGFTLSLAIPLFQRRWPERVPRTWAPTWTVALDDADVLLRAFGLR